MVLPLGREGAPRQLTGQVSQPLAVQGALIPSALGCLMRKRPGGSALALCQGSSGRREGAEVYPLLPPLGDPGATATHPIPGLREGLSQLACSGFIPT